MKLEWNRDEMTPLQRASAISKGMAYDRLQAKPSIGEQPARVLGISIEDYLGDPRLMALAQTKGFMLYGQDGVGVGPDQFALPEAMGARLVYFRNDIPQMGEPIIKNHGDLDMLEPPDPARDGRLPVFIEALEIIRDRIGHIVGVGSGIGGPFTAAAFLRGTGQLLRDMRKSPELVHGLLEITTTGVIAYMEECWRRGFGCGIGEPLASGTVISERDFVEFVKPCLFRIGEWSRKNYGKGYSLHICGDTRRIWNNMADAGASSISLDNMVDLADAREAIGSRVSLGGNVPPVDIMLRGGREDIYQAVKDCISKAGDNPKGYVVGTGCRVPLGTSKENVIHFMDAVRLHGSFKKE